MWIFLSLLLLIFIRNELVFQMQMEARGLINAYPRNYRTYLLWVYNQKCYYALMLDLRKWTFKQFYNEFVYESFPFLRR